MSAATRLLLAAAHGGGAFTPPPFSWTLTSADDGGWTHANAPSAVESGGIVFFGYVDMASGNLEVRKFDPVTGVTSSATVIESAWEVDTHAAPSLFVRSDGKLLVVYSKHDGTTVKRKVSSNTLPDISAFGSSANVASSGLFTYPTVVRYGSALWCFFRDWQSSTTGVLDYATSSDEGDTWSAKTELYKSAGRSSYWMVGSDGSRIDVVATDGRNPPDSGDVTIGHMFYDGAWRKSDGTSIGSPIFDPTDLTEVYDSGDGMGWPNDIVSGTQPVFTYAVLDNPPSTNSWRRAHWTGSSWVNRTVAPSNGTIDTGFVTSVVLDHTHPDRVYAPVYDGAHWQLHAYTTIDDGASWTDRAVTAGSVDALVPKPVYDSSGLVRVVWMSGGPYVSYLDGGFGLSAGR